VLSRAVSVVRRTVCVVADETMTRRPNRKTPGVCQQTANSLSHVGRTDHRGEQVDARLAREAQSIVVGVSYGVNLAKPTAADFVVEGFVNELWSLRPDLNG
jgi:hypothetical protein